MIREHRGSLKVEERMDGAVLVLRFKVTRDSDHRRVERTRVIGRVQDFPTEAQAFAEAERLRLYNHRSWVETRNPDLRRSCRILSARVEEGARVEEAKAESGLDRRRPGAHYSETTLAKVRRKGGSENQTLGDQRVVGVSTGRGRPRELDHRQDPTCNASGLFDGTGKRFDSSHGRSKSTRSRSHRDNNRVRSHSGDPQQAWNIICRIEAFVRLLTLLVAVTGLRIGEVLALKWKHIEWNQFRIRVVSNFVRGKFGEPKSAASKESVVLHPLVMGVLKSWRKTTQYASDEDFIFASARRKGKVPRVPNMLVEDHLRPAAKQVIEIPDGHRFGFHNLRHALTSFLVEIGTDSKTIQDMLRWADPSILLKVHAHSRMDKRMEAQAKMIEAMGLNEETAQQFIQ